MCQDRGGLGCGAVVPGIIFVWVWLPWDFLGALEGTVRGMKGEISLCLGTPLNPKP